ncbi:MAG: LCP family protein [Ardenticatenia bacterium]|nr:LCP family protein [Ardenticatenia bacterium]
MTVYVVQPGDWLYDIARRFNTDPERLAQVNGITDTDTLAVGQVLYIPATPTATPSPEPSATPVPTPIVATPEPKPTQEVAPTPTLPPVWPFGPSQEPPDLPVPPRLLTVLLLGAEGITHWRTDSIMLAMYNPDTGRAGLLSLPRDLWVAVPGYGYRRLNEVDYLAERTEYPGGGPALLRRVFRENFGLPFDHYVRVHFDGFIRTVDTLGGVEVVVDCPIEDIFPDPTDPTQTVHLALEPGVVRLDGKLALLYSRSRLSTTDFDRARRQQQVLQGLWQQVRQPEMLSRVPQLYGSLRDAFVTDLSLEDVVRLAQVALDVEPQNVDFLVVAPPLVENWTTPEGGAVLLLRREEFIAVLSAFLEGLARPPEPAVEPTTLLVENRTPYATWADVAKSRAEWAGAHVVDVVQAPAEGAQTRLLAYRERPATLSALVEALALGPDQVERQPPPQETTSPDMRLILGDDFVVCRR